MIKQGIREAYYHFYAGRKFKQTTVDEVIALDFSPAQVSKPAFGRKGMVPRPTKVLYLSTSTGFSELVLSGSNKITETELQHLQILLSEIEKNE